MRAPLFVVLIGTMFCVTYGLKCYVGKSSNGKKESAEEECLVATQCYHFTYNKGDHKEYKFGCSLPGCIGEFGMFGAVLADSSPSAKTCCDTDFCNSSPEASALFAMGTFVLLLAFLL
ncbi:hypothetical protein QR680_008121 [Steinernema hermaphroditum]|uniref:UPAR/Ly6 domain-containing protein n=1 Tax=Steinernema hermaphroditum TaxID=289476 RepID=A0AA39M6H1_9BILA|nr:hypothetical protein QR680_008121 [Steinernema hermaphroditum]